MLDVQQGSALTGSEDLTTTGVLRASLLKTYLHETVIQPHSLLGILQGLSEAREHHEGGCSVAIITCIFGAGILGTKEKKQNTITQAASQGHLHKPGQHSGPHQLRDT